MFPRTQLDNDTTLDSKHTFVEKTGIEPEELSGDIVLEAGCGMGRFLDVVSKESHIRVVGFDLSLAVESAYRNVGRRPNVHIIQADVMKPPFAPSCFDLVYSIGVLHHTPDPEEAFRQLVPLLKENGLISVWVYPRDSSARLSDIYRHVTTRLPWSMTLGICKAMLLLHAIDRAAPRRLRGLFLGLLPISIERSYERRLLDTFDWYSPRYQFKFAPGDIEKWFRRADLTNIEILPVEVSVRARKRGTAHSSMT
jgi:SAM-dependent methyltransferase